MPFKRNIEPTGRFFRTAAGALLLVSGTIGLFAGIPGETWPCRLFQLLLVLAGAFAIFEGAVGWCALRALGVRTKV